MRKAMYLMLVLIVMAGCAHDKRESIASGFFEAREVTISSQASGVVIDLNLEEGGELQAGEYVGWVDTLDLHLQKLALINKERALNVTKPNLEVMLKGAKEEIKHLQKELSRAKDLAKFEATTPQQVDAISTQLRIAEAKYEALSDTQGSNARSVGFQSEALSFGISQIENSILKSRIMSPITGTVLQKFVELHEFVVPSQPLFVIADLSKMYLKAYVSGDQLKDIQVNQKVTVLIDSVGNEMSTYDGRIMWISDKSEFTPKNIHTKKERDNLVYAVKVLVANDGKIKIGQYGEIAL